MSRLVWLDLETTGLNESRPSAAILEVGIIITDGLVPVVERSWTVANPNAGFMCEPAALSMHMTSGLLDECRTSSTDSVQVQREALDFLENKGALGLPMCGSTIGFDRRWLARHMPELHAAFHYRSLDVSALKVAWSALGLGVPWIPSIPKPHRALPDLRESLAELAHYARQVRP